MTSEVDRPLSHAAVLMDAVSLRTAIQKRHVSCAEVMSAYLDHIEALNPAVNAIVALRDREALLAEAEAQDALLADGVVLGPLHGFPFAVKDLRSVKGIPMTMGSPILKSFIPAVDGLMARRLRNAGAIFVGKTNVPEFGLGSHTFNPVYGLTRNAYDQNVSAGGSSGGAAVALALRMLPVADGSDLGGSLRNPAGWNNVFGFRPSIERVPAEFRDVWLPSMSVFGPMARTVPDLAMLLAVQAGYDAGHPLSLGDNPGAFEGPLDRDFRGTRVAWLSDFGGLIPIEPEVLSVCGQALKVFEHLGCRVEEAQPKYPVEDVYRAWLTLRAWQTGALLLDYYNDPAKRALLKPEAACEVETGLTLKAFDVSAASLVRSQWYEAVRQFFETYDFFVAPTAQLFPFDAALDWPREVAGVPMATYHEWMKIMIPVTMSGCPALAAPAGFSASGLPIGIQIVAPNRAELACLQLAHAYDRETRWVERRPPPLLAG